MIFPFSVNFTESLKTVITPQNKEQALQYIKNSILEDKADNVVVGDMQVRYKGSTSPWRGSLYRGVDNGIFDLVAEGNSWVLKYRINMRQLFIVTSIMSTIMGVIAISTGGPPWIGLVMFLWLCGANWVTNLIRHGSVAVEIAAGIDEIIRNQNQITNNDNEELVEA
jgi:hypothetical protein